MIKLLQVVGAVPFGYTNDTSESDIAYYSGDCVNTVGVSWSHNHYMNAYVSRMLPDIITSNTPPSSPLRRSHSCLGLFHEKIQAQTSPPDLTSSPSILGESDTEAEGRLSHVHEVRRQVQSDASITPFLPDLSWPLPRFPRPSLPQENHREHRDPRRREEDEVGDQRRLWQHIGGELRKMGDQFQENRSSVSTDAESILATSNIPVVVVGCLAGSFLCLICWRLYLGSR